MKDETKKGIAGVGAALVLISGGVAIDAQRNPYTDKGEKLELTVKEEVVEITKDKPEFKLNRWGGEEGITVTRAGEFEESKRAWFSKTRANESVDGKESVIIEPLETADGVKIDIILAEKPDTNVFTFEIGGAENLDFFYQSELTQEEKDLGRTQPENVIGSYAVYHKAKKDNDYQTGKLYHIYRPKIVDSAGAETWAVLSYSEQEAPQPEATSQRTVTPPTPHKGLLSVEVPQEFLDKAEYPVRVDPTFGYTSVGSLFVNIAVNAFGVSSIREGTPFDGVDGTLDSVHAYITEDSGFNGKAKVFVNTKDSGGSGTHGQVFGSSSQDITSDGWQTFASGDESLLLANDYIISAVGGETGGSSNFTGLRLYYDAISTDYYSEIGSFDTPEDPWVDSATSGDHYYSIYATYTAPATPDFQMNINGSGVLNVNGNGIINIQ